VNWKRLVADTKFEQVYKLLRKFSVEKLMNDFVIKSLENNVSLRIYTK
jgi:hypothetical protein